MMEQAFKFIRKKSSINLLSYSEINAGMNNRLFKVTDAGGKNYLLKFYIKDDRQRLKREFTAFSFLRRKGFTNVPEAFIKNSKGNFALYSFEDGSSKRAEEVTATELVAMAKFLSQLHSVRPDDVDIPMPPAVNACFSLDGYIQNINFRYQQFMNYVSNTDAPAVLKQFANKVKVGELIPNLLNEVTRNYDSKMLQKKLPKKDRRLNPLDFGIQNMIFRKGGDICFVDFEFFGFDDPFRLVADFLVHDRSLNLPKEYKDRLLKLYGKYQSLSKEDKQRMEAVIKLTEIEWLTIYLYSMTPEKIKLRQFADPQFNIDRYLKEQIAKFKGRLVY